MFTCTIIIFQQDKCNGTQSTLEKVHRCPHDDKSTQERLRKKGCDKYPTCLGEPLVYHCVRFKKSLVEVCACRGNITGK